MATEMDGCGMGGRWRGGGDVVSSKVVVIRSNNLDDKFGMTLEPELAPVVYLHAYYASYLELAIYLRIMQM